jgi:pimeloyl-ACP methyl ester carboxylesterase
MALALPMFGQPSRALVEYDSSVPLQYQEELFEKKPGIEIAGAGFQSPKGGKVNMIVVRPAGSGPYAGIIFQHGGGQSMATYVGEAEVLARMGALSLILDAPGAAPGKFKPVNEMTGSEMRDYDAEIVICARRAVDYLQLLKHIDPARIAFVGHSYGANTGAVLSATEKRIKTFVLLGGVARITHHVQSEIEYWVDWRRRMTPEQLTRALEEIRPMDPDNFLGASAPAPLLVQCGKFDFLIKDDCEAFYRAAASPKELRWYNTDHSFSDLQAMFDRMEWLESHLKLRPVKPLIDAMLEGGAARR